jgi:sugar phosphate isomerase/epimerase
MSSQHLSRRSFVSLAAAAPFAASAADRSIPIGLELFSVRDELKKDLNGTVSAVAKMGYKVVEFFSPYFEWTPTYAKDVRKLMDDLDIRCLSTHNGAQSFSPENLNHAIELNKILGCKYVVMASAGKVVGLDGWKGVADKLNRAVDPLKSAGLYPGFHNHLLEFQPMEGSTPMKVLAENTTKDVMLQLDVGTCVEAKADPVAWINANPGRIRSMHCKDWAPEKGYKVLIGEGVVPWKDVIRAAEKTGGIEYYLVEQEGSAYPPIETVDRCLKAWRKLHS